MQARGLAAAAIVSLVGAGFSAQALAPSTVAAADKVAAQGYEADDHVPGALYETAVDDNAATAAGMTGTADLPDMPIPGGAVDGGVADTSIQPARPFLEVGSGTDRARALQCLTTAIYYEAATEPDDGQKAVAQVILNRVRHPAFPNTVCGVVYQGSERRGCQFSFACDGSMARGAPSRQYWARAQRVAEAALSGNVFAPVGLATHYHTYAVTPSWNRSLVMTGTWGAHFFHRWKGYWGTAAAFSQRYNGHEPLAAPHARVDPVVTANPVAAAAPAQTPRALIQPQYADSGTPIHADAPRPTIAAASQAQGDESQILDRWRDSGKPLR